MEMEVQQYKPFWSCLFGTALGVVLGFMSVCCMNHKWFENDCQSGCNQCCCDDCGCCDR